MNEQEMISVIVPVYRAEKYSTDCLNSLIKQEYSNIEIILVIDGSPDNSQAICEGFASRDKRIHVVVQENRGVSAARNHGIELARGRYLTFIDSDDYVAPDYLAVLHRDLIDHEVDVACCDFMEVVNGQTSPRPGSRIKEKRRVGKESLFETLSAPDEAFWSCATMKLYKSEFAKACRFKPLRYGEDQVYFYDVCLKMPNLYLDTYKGYFYIRNDDSATVQSGEYGLTKCWDEVHMDRYCYDNYPGESRQVREAYFLRYVYKMQRQVRITLIYNDGAERKQQAPKLRKEIFKLLRTGEKMPGKSRVYFYLYLCCPWVLRRMLLAQNVE